MFQTEKEPGLNGRSLNYPRGKVIGGCSAINAMISMRGQAPGLRPLAAARAHRLGLGRRPPGLQAARQSFPRRHRASRRRRRMAGRAAARADGTVLDAVAKAATEMGIPATPDFNTGDNTGVGYFHVNQKRGVRWSAARAFLKPVLGRANLRLETGVLVEKVVFEGKRAVGVRFRQDGRLVEARAKGEIILSAGAVGSPQILQLSGVGPADWLAELGIAVVHDTPGRRPQPAGPSAAARDLQGPRRQDAERDLPFAGRPRADGRGIRPVPEGPAHHGALAARHLHHVVARARTGEHRVPRPAAVARQVRRSAASLPRHHGQRLQPAADLARNDPAALGRSVGQAGHRAQLSRDATRTGAWRPMRSASRAA